MLRGIRFAHFGQVSEDCVEVASERAAYGRTRPHTLLKFHQLDITSSECIKFIPALRGGDGDRRRPLRPSYRESLPR